MSLHLYENCDKINEDDQTKRTHLLLFSSIVVSVISLFLLTTDTVYVQFVHLLLPSNVATQSQPTLASQSTSSTSLPSTVSLSLPDVFQRVENSIVQITSTKSILMR